MKKRVFLFRHSKKDGYVKDTIGPVGRLLAKEQGSRVWFFSFRREPSRIHKVFHTKLIRTAQTILAFFSHGQYGEYELMPVVEGLGSDEEFIPVCPKDVMDLSKAGVPHFQAMQQCLTDEAMQQWADKGKAVIAGILEQMNDGETALVVGHSPFVEFAVWGATGSLPDICLNLPEMAGFELIQQEDGSIMLGEIFKQPI